MAPKWDPSRPTLGERSGAQDQPDPGRPRPLGTRHCWLAGLPDLPGRHPGLVVEWRRDDARPGWLARVVYTVDDAGSPVLVEAWIPAGHLTPAS